jgi:hypothetical protein
MWEFLSRNASTVLFALVVLACPLMHVFGYRHGGRHHGSREGEGR